MCWVAQKNQTSALPLGRYRPWQGKSGLDSSSSLLHVWRPLCCELPHVSWRLDPSWVGRTNEALQCTLDIPGRSLCASSPLDGPSLALQIHGRKP